MSDDRLKFALENEEKYGIDPDAIMVGLTEEEYNKAYNINTEIFGSLTYYYENGITFDEKIVSKNEGVVFGYLDYIFSKIDVIDECDFSLEQINNQIFILESLLRKIEDTISYFKDCIAFDEARISEEQDYYLRNEIEKEELTFDRNSFAKCVSIYNMVSDKILILKTKTVDGRSL